MTPSPHIQSVSDTALAVAYARALETERDDALFQDPFARSLAGEKGEQIYQQIRGDRSVGWMIVTRTVVLDRLILEAIQHQGVDTVLNLAAGLDTRPYRMALPATLRWVEVDLLALLDYKQAKLANVKPTCQLEQLAVDLRQPAPRRALLNEINTRGKKVLVITEGLLVYLLPETVCALALDLSAQPNFAIWLSDVLSPWAVKAAQWRIQQEHLADHVQLQFAPADPHQFFQSYGWQLTEARSLWHDAHQLKREVWLGKLLRWLSPVKLSIVALKRGAIDGETHSDPVANNHSHH